MGADGSIMELFTGEVERCPEMECWKWCGQIFENPKGMCCKSKVFPSIAQNSDPGGFELVPFHPESSVQTIRRLHEPWAQEF